MSEKAKRWTRVQRRKLICARIPENSFRRAALIAYCNLMRLDQPQVMAHIQHHAAHPTWHLKEVVDVN